MKSHVATLAAPSQRGQSFSPRDAVSATVTAPMP